jgi:hypothetical protein
MIRKSNMAIGNWEDDICKVSRSIARSEFQHARSGHTDSISRWEVRTSAIPH